ncbi:DUF721 domain-containing protein [Algoriphagus namhaensis]
MQRFSSSSRKREAAPLESAFKELLKTYRLEDKFQEKSLIHTWEDLVGQTIASRTSSLYIKDKKLFVKVTSGPIKKELQMNKRKVLDLIEAKYGAELIEDLVCY